MAYITQSDIEALIPPAFIVQALDDDGDGSADSGAWNKVYAAVVRQIHGPLAQRYTVPFTGTLPGAVEDAAQVFACEALYMRRGYHGDENPWTARADAMREKLDKIGAGEIPLSPDHQAKDSAVSAITETSKTYPADGGLIV